MDTSSHRETPLERSQKSQEPISPSLVFNGMELALALIALFGTQQAQEAQQQEILSTVEYDPMRYPLFF